MARNENQVIAVCNFKGGVAKTSSVMNIGAALAAKGKRVLLIDMDPQFNLTTSFGIFDQEATVYDAITKKLSALPVTKIKENLDIVPSSIELNKAELEMSAEFKREERLTELVDAVRDQYDYIIMDCPPSLGLLTINALVASDVIYVPVEPEYLALKGFSVLEQALDKIGMTLDRIFITKFDKRNILHRDIAQSLIDHAGDRVFDTPIRKNIAIPEAIANGQDVLTYDSKCNGASDYSNLTKEIIANG